MPLSMMTLSAEIGGNGHQQIVGNLFAAVGLDDLFLRVHLGQLEIGGHLDILFFADIAQDFRGHRFGEGRGERRHQLNLYFVPDAVDAEKPVRHEGELQGGHRALEGQFGDVDHHPAFFEVLNLLPEGQGPPQSVEIVDVLTPAVDQAFHFFGDDAAAGGDHQQVVGKGLPLGLDFFLVRVDPQDLIQHQVDPGRDELGLGFDAVFLGVDAEGDEEPPRLVVMLPVFVDDGDFPLGLGQSLAHLGGDDGAARPMP